MKRLGLWGCLGVAVVAATGALGAGNDEDELLADILPVYARTGGVYTILIDCDEFYPPTFGYQLTPHTNRVASLECTWPGTFNAYLRTGHQGENPTIIVSQGIERSNDQYDYYLLYKMENGEMTYDYEQRPWSPCRILGVRGRLHRIAS